MTLKKKFFVTFWRLVGHQVILEKKKNWKESNIYPAIHM